MNKVLNIIIIVLALLLVGIIIYPQWQEGRTVELNIGCDPSVNATVFLVAQNKEFFSENRIKPNFIFYENPDLMIKDFLSDSLDCALLPWPAILNLAKTYDSIYVLASALYRTSLPVDGIFVLPKAKNPIKQIKDLKNKRLGYSPLFKNIINVLIYNLGFKPQEVKLIELPNSELVSALKNNQVDAILVIEPERTCALNDSLVPLMMPALPKAIIGPFPGCGVVIKSAPVIQKKRFATRFKTVLDAAVTYAGANTEESRKIFLDYYKLDTIKYRTCYLPDYEKLAELNRGLIIALNAKIAEVDSSFKVVNPERLIPQAAQFRQ
ncbi:MAG: ABC transporter substrate-binding protein [candidate division WOR-3 bacterium]|nr:ABC transporter substrate-binding protein [candidate division WOR-3 bacterium]MCX7756905.1 ABC transporter substrate-binding protein [candidate division WOR-3 bacterium]MDW7987852.1 ABC transporter substrate-binding protein [candidate division WOR-3 bacterium]